MKCHFNTNTQLLTYSHEASRGKCQLRSEYNIFVHHVEVLSSRRLPQLYMKIIQHVLLNLRTNTSKEGIDDDVRIDLEDADNNTDEDEPSDEPSDEMDELDDFSDDEDASDDDTDDENNDDGF
ncbi:hypothetical protein Tco_0267775 [Tanacetum coccineum]